MHFTLPYYIKQYKVIRDALGLMNMEATVANFNTLKQIETMSAV